MNGVLLFGWSTAVIFEVLRRTMTVSFPVLGIGMGHNHRNDEIFDNIERMRRDREAYADAVATMEQFNARLSAKKSA
jgi:hypothetical protein